MSPCSVPTAGVHGATMGINITSPKTPAGPEHSCLWGNLGAARLCPRQLVTPAGRCGVPACRTVCLRAGAFRLTGCRSRGVPPCSQHCLQIQYCSPCSGSADTGQAACRQPGTVQPHCATACSEGGQEGAIFCLNLPTVQNIRVFPCWRRRWGCSCALPLPTCRGQGGPAGGASDAGCNGGKEIRVALMQALAIRHNLRCL